MADDPYRSTWLLVAVGSRGGSGFWIRLPDQGQRHLPDLRCSCHPAGSCPDRSAAATPCGLCRDLSRCCSLESPKHLSLWRRVCQQRNDTAVTVYSYQANHRSLVVDLFSLRGLSFVRWRVRMMNVWMPHRSTAVLLGMLAAFALLTIGSHAWSHAGQAVLSTMVI